MQNCIDVTSLAAFQSADLLLSAVSESLRTGSGISKTLKDHNRKIRGHFGFRTFEKKKTTARNGFSSTIQNDMPHTKSAVPASAKRPPELSQLFIQAARVALSRHVFFLSFFSSQRPSSKRCAKCRHCFHTFPEKADLSGKCVKKVRIRCDARLDMRVITGIDAETQKTNMRRLFHFFSWLEEMLPSRRIGLILRPLRVLKNWDFADD